MTGEQLQRLIRTFQILTGDAADDRTETADAEFTKEDTTRKTRGLDVFLANAPASNGYALYYTVLGTDWNYLYISARLYGLDVFVTMKTREQAEAVAHLVADMFGDQKVSIAKHLTEEPEDALRAFRVELARKMREGDRNDRAFEPARGDTGEEIVVESVRREGNESTEAQASAAARPVIFIGHGHGSDWRDLKDDLHEKCSYRVEHFNREEQAGRSNKEVLQRLLKECNVAFLVMTAEDEMPEGSMRARENVVHEAGLFQGCYGFERAIIVREDGRASFSNVDGLVEIRYPSGHIQEVFHKVRDVIMREFAPIS